jgi:hypothetical protein
MRAFSDMLEATPRERAVHQLRFLDLMIAAAIKDGKYVDAAKLSAESQRLLKIYGAR